MTVLVPLLVAMAAAPAALAAGRLRPDWSWWVATLASGATFGLLLGVWWVGDRAVRLDWVPTWSLYLDFSLDGLALLYSVLASGIGFVVLVFSRPYIVEHLRRHERGPQEQTRFYTLMALFMGSMVGLSLARDLLLVFVLWEFTTVTSYLLIGYDREKPESRRAALMALLVTGGASVGLLLAVVLLYVEYATFSVAQLVRVAEPGPVLSASMALVLLAAVAKSAQFPLHFWLPRAMAAPTPVSAYLHSASMVAAGLFLVHLTYPLLDLAGFDWVLAGIGVASMIVGGGVALTRDDLKGLLAYSTIAQYGYMFFLAGLGGTLGVAASAFYLAAHAIAKSGLFLTEGAVDLVTGERSVSRVGGLARAYPLLAVAAAIVAGALAGVPLTVGYFKDEFLYETALEHGGVIVAAAVVSAAITVAYTWRFWAGAFLGEPTPRDPVAAPPRDRRPVPPLALGSLGVLALAALVLGVFVRPFVYLAEEATLTIVGGPGNEAAAGVGVLEAVYRVGTPLLLGAVAFGLGAALASASSVWFRPLLRFVVAIGRLGPMAWYGRSLSALQSLARQTYRLESVDPGSQVFAVLVSTGVLVFAAFVAAPRQLVATGAGSAELVFGHFAGLILVAVAGAAVALTAGDLSRILALAAVGYALSALFAFMGAPDVALVAALAAIASSIVFIPVLLTFRPPHIAREPDESRGGWWRYGGTAAAVVAGLSAFFIAWSSLEEPPEQELAAVEQLRLTPAAHAEDAVGAILTDFRGLDTAGEVTVLLIAMIGVFALYRGRGEI